MGRPRVSRSGIPLDAAPQTHAIVLGWLAELPRGRVLDCPSGRGALAHELAAAGFAVVGVDLGGAVLGRGYDRVRADLNRPLPFTDAAFDAVACVEGIEHLERPVDALREFHRVLRPGGTLVLTTPNVLHLGSRVRMALTGFWSSAPRPFDGAAAPTGFEHIMLLSYPALAYFLQRTGFRVERLDASRVVKGSLPWGWLAPLVAAATRLALRRPQERDVARALTGRRLLFGHALCLRCRRV
jgi:SAM-dependent methyltransferase